MYTLYVGRDRRNRTRSDAGSALCLRLTEHLQDVHVVECMSHADAPEYVLGTPTLVNDESNEILAGFQAVVYLQDLVVHSASAPSKPAARMMMTGRVQLKPEKNVESFPPAPGGVAESSQPDALGKMWDPIDAEVVENEFDCKKLTQEDLTRLMRQRGE